MKVCKQQSKGVFCLVLFLLEIEDISTIHKILFYRRIFTTLISTKARHFPGLCWLRNIPWCWLSCPFTLHTSHWLACTIVKLLLATPQISARIFFTMINIIIFQFHDATKPIQFLSQVRSFNSNVASLQNWGNFSQIDRNTRKMLNIHNTNNGKLFLCPK